MRLQVNISENMLKKIENYSSEFGISKSAFCSMLIGQGILGLDSTKDVLTNLSLDLLSKQKQEKK